VQYPGQPYDESDYIQEVVSTWDLKANFVPEETMTASILLDSIERSRDFPDFPNGALFNRVMALVQKKGSRVVLNGYGGDEWLSGSLYHSADLLVRLKVLKAIRQSRADAKGQVNAGVPRSSSFMFLYYGLWPILPKLAQRGIKAVLGKNGTGVPFWMTSKFARSTGLVDRFTNTGAPPDLFTTRAAKDIGDRLNFPHYWLIDRYTSRFGLEYRYPFLDRRLISYCLALPHEQLRPGSQAKLILRQAMRGLLPELVRSRPTKTRFGTHSFWDALRAVRSERLIDSLLVASQGWVNADSIKKMHREILRSSNPNDVHAMRFLYPIWTVCAIELWFRAVFVDENSHLMY
jgi:asparagine synthase (glutamine-hydrolysing)